VHNTGITGHVVKHVIKIFADEEFALIPKSFLTKLNGMLVHIIKLQWPHALEKFIPDTCRSSQQSQ